MKNIMILKAKETSEDGVNSSINLVEVEAENKFRLIGNISSGECGYGDQYSIVRELKDYELEIAKEKGFI